MWLHRNSTLHDPKMDDCRQMKGAAVNAAITSLYANVDSYAAEDRWRFDMPLALRLRKPLRSRQRWLAITRILVEKSRNDDPRGQSQMTTYFRVLSILRPRQRHMRPSESRPSVSILNPSRPHSDNSLLEGSNTFTLATISKIVFLSFGL